jgi:protein-S-isoprenylcysteine O-methyltransferase Ste14
VGLVASVEVAASEAQAALVLQAALVQQPEVDFSDVNVSERTELSSFPSEIVRRALTIFAPALVLAWLGISQARSVASGWSIFVASPNWTLASELARSALYAAFVLGAAIILVRNKVPRSRNANVTVVASSLVATFLMVVVSYFPSGPLLWSASVNVLQIGLAITVLGAALAFSSFVSLGSNFSIVPEARSLVVSGPYRVLRHPIYLAELLMIGGVAVGEVRLTTLLAALCVIALQIYRIRAEEKVLREAFPSTFVEFSERTRFRLFPLIW